ncbi:HDOD domain-containing protein [Chitinispirillales bacterium ANBcel5]|uniref:HDOD domain-containing protein n=1 Tax=Cellulosispirillum alkaliphilum TaxID=3039283 RepID=UPI002A5019D4|nr:HDOD domain-containing protein [Chitinispirillales bacterium ANBcel5]
MNTSKNTDKLSQNLQSTDTIPTIPEVICSLTALLENPRTSAEEIGRAIKSDQALASKVLKLVNSAFYGFPGRIGSITHAVVILGFSTVKNVILTASILQNFRTITNSSQEFDAEQFWLHSVACGVAAKCIARHQGHSNCDDFFTAGLIHDIGKIIFFHYMQEEFWETIKYARQKDALFFDCEKQLFSITHQEIGGELARRWNLPLHLKDAISYHHTPSVTRHGYDITAVVHLADIFVRALSLGNGGDTKIPVINEDVWRYLGFERISLITLFENIEKEVIKANVFLQLS